MIYQAGESTYLGFTTNNATGAATNADSLPTASLLRNGAIDNAVTVTVTNLSTGAYSASWTVPSGYSVGDEVELLISATVGGVTPKRFAGRGKIDATISSRSTFATGGAVTLQDGAITAAKIATGAIDADALAADAATEIATAVASAITLTPFAVLGLRTTLSGVDADDYIPVIGGDDKSVGIFFEDGSGNPAPIPTGATAAMLDSAGTAVGTATVTDSKVQVGYLLIRLQVPGSGNRPSTLRISFNGGSGGAYKHDVPMRAWS